MYSSLRKLSHYTSQVSKFREREDRKTLECSIPRHRICVMTDVRVTCVDTRLGGSSRRSVLRTVHEEFYSFDPVLFESNECVYRSTLRVDK